MKAQKILIFIISFVFLYSCNSKSTKETKLAVNTKDSATKKIPNEPVVQEQPFVYGIDISSYQGDETDVINAHKDSIGFVISKATQGAYGTDPKFKDNWSQVKKDGFIRGAYHFYMSKDDPVLQAKHFVTVVGTFESTDLPPVVDFESGGIEASESIENVVQGLNTFIATVEKLTGRKPMIYTDIPVADKYLSAPKFANYALWIANYVNKPAPDLPTTWKEAGWTFWQRDADYKLDSFTDDSDVFNGDRTKLLEFIKTYH